MRERLEEVTEISTGEKKIEREQINKTHRVLRFCWPVSVMLSVETKRLEDRSL
jgi:hypothetical protein